MHSKLILGCREEDALKIAKKTLMIRFWPFVDEFPEIIRRHQLRIFFREFLRHPLGSIFLADAMIKILSGIRSDEKDHRSLWLDTSSALGLSETDLYFGNASQNEDWYLVQDLIKKVGENVSIFRNKILPSTSLLRLAAVEIVAESISHELIVVFNDFGEKATAWFKAHIYHKEGVISHEELVYKLAFAFDGKDPDKEKVDTIISEVVDLFVEAGEVPY